jgi:hypothetical protein
VKRGEWEGEKRGEELSGSWKETRDDASTSRVFGSQIFLLGA